MFIGIECVCILILAASNPINNEARQAAWGHVYPTRASVPHRHTHISGIGGASLLIWPLLLIGGCCFSLLLLLCFVSLLILLQQGTLPVAI